ncbi:MAG: hypothetical protein IT371_15525 [Deltaproteobacteria bacterium]|nr:hypothetical protein [Deltaproteobacteria bacterium]
MLRTTATRGGKPRWTLGHAVVILASAATLLLPALANARAAEPNCPNGGLVAADGRLQAQPLQQVLVRSWNGRRLPPQLVVQPVQVANPRFPARALDPMAVYLRGCQPETRISVGRQRTSAAAQIPGSGRIESCDQARGIAEAAARYVNVLEFVTGNAGINEPAVLITHNPQHVFWPNSIYKIEGTTRDGQRIPTVTGLVAGLPQQQETRFDHYTQRQENYRVSGDLLPSARAWLRPGNLYASEPTQNQAQINEGRALLQSSEEKANRAQEQQVAYDAEYAKARARQPYDQNIVNAYPNQIQTLRNEANNERARGQAAVQEGERIRVNVLSLAATPAHAAVTHANRRLRNENAPLNVANGVTEGYHGFSMLSVGGLARDLVDTTVRFGAVAGQQNGSARTVTWRVPDGANQRHSFIMEGVRYFAVQVENEQQLNDAVQERY